jgi:hypothetical protein
VDAFHRGLEIYAISFSHSARGVLAGGEDPFPAVGPAIRRLLHHKSYSLINILGQAIGLSACLLLYLYMHEELRVLYKKGRLLTTPFLTNTKRKPG